MERVINKNVWVLGTSWAKLLISFKKEFSLEKSEGFQSLFFYLNKPKYPNKKYSRQAVVGIILTYSFSCSKKGGVATGCL